MRSTTTAASPVRSSRSSDLGLLRAETRGTFRPQNCVRGVWVCDGPHSADPEKEYPWGTAGSSDADPEEVGAAEAWIHPTGTEHLRVLKPRRGKVREGSFSPGGEETRTENETEGEVLMWSTGGGGCREGDEPSFTRALRAEDNWEEQRSGQARHILGRTWPSQVRPTTEMGHGEEGEDGK
ncbi:hypothetical protein NDU88_006947 [Pleurodeles waltl]|uniref:Uncharacterized protein n=1 Tax=Pleurodeles waltl TaxID=8319 RepID=A0AAV7P0V1_PLEWA|nr:hypothetical protein NDU88_006947 [Pleurodeles waltl]